MIYDAAYSCVTRYQLLCMILHRLKSRNGTAVLYLVNLTFTDDDAQRVRRVLVSAGVFDEVRLYDETGVWNRLALEVSGTASRKKAGSALEERDMPGVKKRVLQHFATVIRDVPVDRTVWYVAGDQYTLGLALVFSEVAYVQFEEHSGSYDRPELFLNTLVQLNPFQHKIYTFTAAARERLITRRIVDSISGQSAHESASVDELRVRTTLDELGAADLAMVSAAFGYDPAGSVLARTDAALVITQPFARWKFIDWSQQRELFATIVDFFAPTAELVIKPHPQDDLTPYRLWFPGAHIVPAGVPMELVMTRMRPSIALTVASTAIFALQASDTRTVFLGQGFEQEYRQLPRLFAVATLFDWLGIRDVACADGFPEDALGAFMGSEARLGSAATEPSALVCWEAVPEGACREYEVVVSLTPLPLPDPDLFHGSIVVQRQQRGRPYATQTLVHLYTKDRSRIDDARGKTLKRTLPHLDEDLTIVFPADDDVAFLQAQVASLEARVRQLSAQAHALD